MKLSLGKRVLMFFHWLLSLLIVAAFAVYLIVPDFLMTYYNRAVDSLGYSSVKIIGIALLAIYVLLAAAQACLIFKRAKKSERGFITVDSSDSGKVRIAISAIEQMVRQSVNNIDGITEMKIGIENQDDAIGIIVNASILNGSHVPTITMNMQRAIRQFVETNCGVAVRTVAISINSVTAQAESSRKRRLGKIKETPAPVTPSVNRFSYDPEPEPEPAPAPVYVPERKAEPEPEPVSMPTYEAPKPEPTAEPAPEYDLDAPYESQFARDLAELKARESGEGPYGEADAPAEDAE